MQEGEVLMSGCSCNEKLVSLVDVATCGTVNTVTLLWGGLGGLWGFGYLQVGCPKFHSGTNLNMENQCLELMTLEGQQLCAHFSTLGCTAPLAGGGWRGLKGRAALRVPLPLLGALLPPPPDSFSPRRSGLWAPRLMGTWRQRVGKEIAVMLSLSFLCCLSPLSLSRYQGQGSGS